MTSIKDPNERVAVNIQIPAMLKEKMDKAAAARGMGFSNFARKSFHLCAHFTPGFWSALEHLSEIYGTGESRVIENLISARIGDIKNLAGFVDEENESTVEIPETETVETKPRRRRNAKK